MSEYEALVANGCIGSMKRDVLLEAASDIEYLVQVRERFRPASAAAARDARDYTVRLVRELVDGGYCRVATWTGGPRPMEGCRLWR